MMAIPENETGPWAAPCPRCGEPASVRLSGQETVEVACPNCGTLEVLRAEFDEAQANIVEPDEP